jgi:hypothetical protein
MSVSTIDLVADRLSNQRLSRTEFRTAVDVVAWHGAMQSQDYAGAKWAIGQRARRLADADIERAFNAGEILRTHVMRPTWHFVAPADIRWMLTLTAPRVHAVMAYYNRLHELDAKLLKRSRSVFEKSLREGSHLTRTELAGALSRAGIEASGARLGHIMMHAELEQVICSGPRRGKQFTYALLAERAPQAKVLEPDDALAALTSRYFASHGPATIRDFSWWSGLTTREVKRGIEIAKPALASETTDGCTYWFARSRPARRTEPAPVYLLPNYDEYGIAYKDREALVDATITRPASVAYGQVGYVELPHLLIVDGKWTGSWKQTVTATAVRVDVKPARPLTKDERRAVVAAADRYGEFLKVPATVAWR